MGDGIYFLVEQAMVYELAIPGLCHSVPPQQNWRIITAEHRKIRGLGAQPPTGDGFTMVLSHKNAIFIP